jgi:hypothetical protein
MRNARNIFLATAAGLALVAATGLASAQQPSNEGAAKQPHAATQSMKPSGQMDKRAQGAQPGKMGEMQNGKQGSAQSAKGSQQVGQSATSQGAKGMGAKHAQRVNRNGKAARARMGEHRHGRFAQRNEQGRFSKRNGQFAHQNAATRGRAGATTAEGENRNMRGEKGLQGLQGNAAAQAGGNVRLNAQQRMTIRQSVINAPDAPRMDRVPFGVRVGTVIPGDFRVVPVPQTLVTIDPAWGGYLYFVYRHEVVIVNPATRGIVAVLPA